MPNSLWSAIGAPHEPAAARERIAAQHRRIRELLQRARSTAEAALDGRPAAPDAVASAIGDIRTVMEVHMTFEEQALTDLLPASDRERFQREQWLREDHSKQRAKLADLHGEASRHPELPTLAAKLAFLATWLLRDMAEEEDRLGLPPTEPTGDQEPTGAG